MTELKIKMTTAAYRQLKQAAAQNFRPPNDHARYIILKSLGLVTDDGPGIAQTNNRCGANDYQASNVTAVAVVNP